MMINTEPSHDGKHMVFLFTEIDPVWDFMISLEKQHPAIFIPHVYAMLQNGIKDGTRDGDRRWTELLQQLPRILNDIVGFR